jgi:hypothetical protein
VLDVQEPPSLVALVAFAVAIGAGLWQLPSAFRDAYREVGDLRTASTLERELGGARRVDVDTRVYVAAGDVIPADATYAVVTGPHVQVSNPATLHAVAPFAGYWLLPRRRVHDPRAADWIVSYGGDVRALGLEYVTVVDVAPGIALALVRR